MWEHTVGGEHATFVLRADYQAQLRRAHDELGFRYLRFHGSLSDDMSVLVSEGRRSTYSFFNLFRAWDFLISIGMRPFVELSFMPGALASGSSTVFRYRGNVTPPRDYKSWGTLLRTLTRAAIDRYGLAEVKEWYFEVWNEPNLRSFWRGNQAGYFRLYRESVRAIKSVDSELRVGGPATAKNAWLDEFMEFCARESVPVDFVSTHHYPTDHAGPGKIDVEAALAATDRDAMQEQAHDARRIVGATPLMYTEWNSSSDGRDPRHDESYAAAFDLRTALDAALVVDAYAFWTFSDLFEEKYLSSVPFHGGFGLLNVNGIPKPAYRAFQMLHELSGEMIVPVDGIHSTIAAHAFKLGNGVQIILTNFAMPRHVIGHELVRVRVDNAPTPRSASIALIDAEHGNVKRAWEEMGAPTYLTDSQIGELESASQTRATPLEWSYDDAGIVAEVDLGPYAVAAISFLWQ